MRLLKTALILSLFASEVHADIATNFVSRMAKAIDYVENNQSTVWPGFHLKATPIVIDFYQEGVDHVFALNFTPHDLPWKKLTIDNYPVYYLEENLIDTLLYQYEGKMREVDHEKSFIDIEADSRLPWDEQFYNKLTTMRALYYLRNESTVDKQKLSGLVKPYDGFYQPMNVKLMFLETAALNVALRDKNEEALQDATAIHQYRSSLLSNDLNTFENAYEFFRGIPHYISLKSLNLSDEDYLRITSFNNCEPLTQGDGMDLIFDCVLAQYPHYINNAYGYLLDQKLSSSWKTNVESDFKTPSNVMQAYYHMTDSEAKSLTEKAIENPRYHYKEIEKQVDPIIRKEVNMVSAAVKQYDALPGIEFTGPWFWNETHLRIKDIYLINLQDTLLENVNGELNDAEGSIITFNQLPFGHLIVLYNGIDDYDNAHSSSKMKLQPESTLILDGVKTTVENAVKMREKRAFHSLIIQDKYVNVDINSNGELDTTEGKIRLKLANVGRNSANIKHVASQSSMLSFIRKSKLKH